MTKIGLAIVVSILNVLFLLLLLLTFAIVENILGLGASIIVSVFLNIVFFQPSINKLGNKVLKMGGF